jgi:hypothetical protein
MFSCALYISTARTRRSLGNTVPQNTRGPWTLLQRNLSSCTLRPLVEKLELDRFGLGPRRAMQTRARLATCGGGITKTPACEVHTALRGKRPFALRFPSELVLFAIMQQLAPAYFCMSTFEPGRRPAHSIPRFCVVIRFGIETEAASGEPGISNTNHLAFSSI